MKRRKIARTAAMFTLAGALALGGAAAYTTAYLTDHEGVVNEFTVGKVKIDLTETNWNPDNHTRIQPSEEIPKNPAITNTGVNDAYVYLEVSIPMKEVITADEDGNRQEARKQELFSFEEKAGWKQLKREQSGDNMVYTYNYSQVLAKGQTTGTLFDSVKFLNIIEGQLDTEKLDIPVKAFAIQTENTGNTGSSVDQKAAAAYNKYMNQNRDQEGRVTVQTPASSQTGAGRDTEEPGEIS
ncbi:MAG: SipW-dependent-type signal peptide-containing protein [Eubacteriales bacterium]|nr:SipW-dependent-type signal peptide-containing protein [Eubacteriales bacterium]